MKKASGSAKAKSNVLRNKSLNRKISSFSKNSEFDLHEMFALVCTVFVYSLEHLLMMPRALYAALETKEMRQTQRL